jgi:hypothetical protein
MNQADTKTTTAGPINPMIIPAQNCFFIAQALLLAVPLAGGITAPGGS